MTYHISGKNDNMSDLADDAQDCWFSIEKSYFMDLFLFDKTFDRNGHKEDS